MARASVPAMRLSAAGHASLSTYVSRRPEPFSAQTLAPPSPIVRSFHASPLRQAETVQVPQMAESISEGTLKQWNKKKGDYVNQDEEVATIETDKVGMQEP